MGNDTRPQTTFDTLLKSPPPSKGVTQGTVIRIGERLWLCYIPGNRYIHAISLDELACIEHFDTQHPDFSYTIVPNITITEG